MKTSEIWNAIENKDISGLSESLAKVRTEKTSCDHAIPCGYRDENICLYEGEHGSCPLVKAFKRGEYGK